MSTQVSQSDDWIQLQINVFTRWVQNQLKDQPDIHIDTITKDLSNGVALVELAKTLTQTDTPRNWAPAPKRTVEMVQNCDLAVEMFTKDGVNLVGISGKDVNDNNEKLILGLIWSLILYYSIGKSINTNSNDNKQNSVENIKEKINQVKALKSWATERIENYPNNYNFTPYELSMCALLDSYVPNKINYYSLNPSDRDHNSNLATNVMKELGIPIYIYPDDLKGHDSKVDDKTLLTQLSTMKSVLDERESKIVERNEKINDEKSDVESESETIPDENDFSNHLYEENEIDQESIIKADSIEPVNDRIKEFQFNDDFSNTLFEEYEIDQESIIKTESVEPINSFDNGSNNQHSTNDFEFKLFEEDSLDNESQIKTDANQQNQLPEIEIIPVERNVDKQEHKLTDNLLDHDYDLKVDSRGVKRGTANGNYRRIDTGKKFSFFDWVREKILKPIESLFKQPEADARPYARVCLLYSPITPFFYYVDYSRD